MFKYGSIENWQPKAVDGGFLLTASGTPRVILVTAKGVFECSPDGAPVHLLDNDLGEKSPSAFARLTQLTQSTKSDRNA